MIIAILDSGATASVTYDVKHLINLRPCTGMFGQANGQLSLCIEVGDVRVIARTQNADGTVGNVKDSLVIQEINRVNTRWKRGFLSSSLRER